MPKRPSSLTGVTVGSRLTLVLVLCFPVVKPTPIAVAITDDILGDFHKLVSSRLHISHSLPDRMTTAPAKQWYRKIPGDRCQGGMNPAREVKDLKKKCTSNFLNPKKQNSKSNSVPIILAIVGLMLVTVVAGVLIVKKYVCGGRFLVHRYSVLQQHAEADGVDALDTASHAKSGYHDDSDEIQLGPSYA
ncbi:hypothetical protein U0070_004243 [Myodes glareolus]|uniref:Uncharacterized protein n=1 Tax=Myodes glareolus TaxID=447135 RepID=A0AAW0H5M6_MYOGA